MPRHQSPSEPMLLGRKNWRHALPNGLTWIVATPVLTLWLSTQPLRAVSILGHSLVVALPILGALGAVFSASLHQPRHRSLRVQTVVYAAWTLSWATILIRQESSGEAWNYAVAALPLSLLALTISAPGLEEVQSASRQVLMLILALCALELFTGDHASPLDRPLDGRWSLGDDGRWQGAFGHPNVSGAVLVLAICLSLSIPQKWLVRCITTGSLAVLIVWTGSRAAMFAAAAAVMWAVVARLDVGSKQRFAWQPVTFIVGLLLGAVVVALIAPGLGGRAVIWGDYLAYVYGSPLGGVGSAKILQDLSIGFIDSSAQHGHSDPLDLLARYGLIASPMLIANVGIALIALRSSRKRPEALTMAFGLFPIVLTETLGSPLYLTVVGAWWLLVLHSATAPAPSSRP